MLIIFFVYFIKAFIYNDPIEYTNHFEIPQYTQVSHWDSQLDISLYWENKHYLNYSDKLYSSPVASDSSTKGVCGPLFVEFDTNVTYMFGNITYYTLCNISSEIYWNWPTQSICNTTNKICKPVYMNDIFHIHKFSYRVYDIQDTLFIYEQIAYIQPEIWIVVIVAFFLCCFGVHTYNIAGSKIVT